MMRSRHAARLAIMLGLVVSAALGQQVPPELGTYVVLATSDVGIRREARVASGAVGAVGGTVRFGRDVRVSGRVAAPSVQLAAGVQTGSLFCHFVSGPPPLPGCMAFTDPLVDPVLLQPVTVVPGSADLVVRAGTGTAPVPAGSFRDVRVGRGALLQLAGGAYTAQSVTIGARAQIECIDPCVIGVVDTIRLKRRAHLGAAVPTRANTVRVDVAAVGGTALLARPRASVAATIFAPASAIVLGSRGEYRGAFVGATVTVAPDAVVRHDSAL